MFSHDLQLPPEPQNVKMNSNEEILRRLGHDLTGIDREELSSTDTYRVYRHIGGNRQSWGYCLEAARVEDSEETLILFRRDEEADEER